MDSRLLEYLEHIVSINIAVGQPVVSYSGFGANPSLRSAALPRYRGGPCGSGKEPDAVVCVIDVVVRGADVVKAMPDVRRGGGGAEWQR